MKLDELDLTQDLEKNVTRVLKNLKTILSFAKNNKTILSRLD